jgi:HCOMODA/2-hydroxy-3-carboxy-muconic semialdehyde decarboxylase
MSNVPLRAAFPLAGFLGTGVPVFEMRSVAGDASNLLVSDKSRGDALVKQLGDAQIILMRGHGDTVVGSSIKLAVARAIYAEVNARVEMDALRLGQPVFLSDGEVAASRKLNDQDFSAMRPWEIWKAKAMRELGGR